MILLHVLHSVLYQLVYLSAALLYPAANRQTLITGGVTMDILLFLVFQTTMSSRPEFGGHFSSRALRPGYLLLHYTKGEASSISMDVHPLQLLDVLYLFCFSIPYFRAFLQVGKGFTCIGRLGWINQPLWFSSVQ